MQEDPGPGVGEITVAADDRRGLGASAAADVAPELSSLHERARVPRQCGFLAHRQFGLAITGVPRQSRQEALDLGPESSH